MHTLTKNDVILAEHQYGIIAYIPDTFAGVAELGFLTNGEGYTLYFNRLIVRPEYRGRGYSTILVEKVLDHCRSKGYSILNHVNAYGELSQEVLEAFYTRHGFTKIAEATFVFIP